MSQWNTSRRGHSGSRSGRGGDDQRITMACLQIVDLGMGAIIFVGPHLLGGRHLLGRFAIVAACLVTATAWFVGQYFKQHAKWRPASGLGILFLAIGMVTLQLVPLPDEWLATLSPRISQVLPLWHSSSGVLQIGQWHTISLSPEDTRLALATLIAYAMLFVTAVQRLDSVDDVKRIVQWTASSAVIVAAFGIVQYFTANGKFFWVYEYPYTDTLHHLKAGFTSRNHFAHFLVLGLACLLSWTLLQRHARKVGDRTSGPSQRFSQRGRSTSPSDYAVGAQSVAIAVLVFAVLASLSRGAVLAMLAAVAVMAVCYATAGLLRSRHVLAAGILGIFLMIALSLSGDYEHVTSRLETFTSQSLDDLDAGGGRRLVWSANIAAFQADWLTGSGAGSHRFTYPLYLSEPVSKEFTHAENGYLQVATENGLPGVVLLAAALLCCSHWCFSAMRNAGENHTLFILSGGITAALTASIVHSIVDFVWFIPACATVTILLAACALRLAQLAESPPVRSAARPSLRKLSKFNMALASSLAGIWALVTLFPSAQSSLEWDSYLLADKASQNAEMRQLAAAGTANQELTEAEQLNSQSSLRHLFKVLRMYPQSARAHVRLAGGLLNRFESLQHQSANQMTIGQIREAAQASHFASPETLRDWLERAFGTNCRLLYLAHNHARQAAALCPLQGEAYIYLAELSFLEGQGSSAVEAYSNQGLVVRPQDPDVLFAVGKQNLVNGNVDQALSLWRAAYRGVGRHQYLINKILTGDMSAANFIKVFQPTWSPLQNLWSSYRDIGNVDDLNILLPYASGEASRQVASLPPPRSGIVWWGLARMQKDMGLTREALESLQLAYAANPDNFSIRYDLGKCLASFEHYELAESHLRWCLGQYPKNASLRAELLQLSRAKMQRMARDASTAIH